MSDYLENALLDHVLRNTAFTQPAALYLALFSTDPTDAGTGAEVTGGGYTRQAISFNAASGGVTTSDISASFSAAGTPIGAVSYFAIFDALSGGNMLFHGALTTPREVLVGQTITFAAGAVTVTLD